MHDTNSLSVGLLLSCIVGGKKVKTHATVLSHEGNRY